MGGIQGLLPSSWREDRYRVLDGHSARALSLKISRRKPFLIGLAVTLFLFCLYVNSGSPVATIDFCDHPVPRLVHDAQQAFNATLARQSNSLDEAIAEYHRRYGMPPPPYFDKWYEFATERETVLIDEFDTIYHALLPFWGVRPDAIRSRVTEDLGFENFMMGVRVQNGTPSFLTEGQGDFQASATMEIMSMFGKWLPDMDLAFNTHDEPRVVVPHEELHRMAVKGREAQHQLQLNRKKMKNGFSNTPVNPINNLTTTRYNNIERQETWLYSRLSCPPDTPVKDLDGNAPDNSSAYAIEPLGFVYNQTAASDMCLSPSLRHRLGVFERPNSFKLTNELAPVFSMSRPSSFQDIVVPSPFYYKQVASYDGALDVPWDQKIPQVYWRGSPSGGHSRGGSWRNLQRQWIVGHLTHPENTKHVLQETRGSACSTSGGQGWKVREVNGTEMQQSFSLGFFRISDCDEDCLEEEEYFPIMPLEPQEEAWRHRYLLDMDGHAYSGRFYALMRSSSLPMKVTFFREWHDNVLVPWVHYVPFNKDAYEIPELVRFFENDHAGRDIAKSIAEEGQKWAQKVLRNQDMEVYMFRLLLEYVSTNRTINSRD